MTIYKTDAENAATIRQSLKKLYGITSRQVSVTSRTGSIVVRIHDHTVDIREVRNIADKFESVRRCEMTGEILCGGNHFLDVAYSEKATAAYAAAHADEIAAVLANGEGTVDGKPCAIHDGSNGDPIVWHDGKPGHFLWRGMLNATTVASEILHLRSKV